MHVASMDGPEIERIIDSGVEKLLARGVSRRRAVHRTARKHGVRPRQVSALIASEDGTREVGC